jgi:dipeptidyl aminopeptidase/acylaminoacyl peptidase
LALSFSTLRSLGDELFWIEGRPELGGRRVVVRQRPGEAAAVVSPDGLSLSSRVHEYGGGELAVADDDGPLIVGVRADQAIVRFRPLASAEDVLIEAAPGVARGDVSVSAGVLSYIEEAHAEDKVHRSVRALRLSDRRASELTAGRDFYAGARLSPDGTRFVVACWDHPNMPWEASEVWTAGVDAELRCSALVRVDGGLRSAASHPIFTADGSIVVLAERDGWTRPVRHRDGLSTELGVDGVEYGGPIWSLGEEFLAEVAGRLFAVEQRGASARVVELVADGSSDLGVEGTARVTLAACAGELGWMGSTPLELGAVGRVPMDGSARSAIRLGPPSPLGADQVLSAVAFEAVGSDGRVIHGVLYQPKNGSIQGPPEEPPPVVVTCHGGPTAQASVRFEPLVALLTSRGYCVVAANYAGSTGFGAAYRRRLEGSWGVADVADCVELVSWLAARGVVDASRAAIRGGSSGGMTALLAATSGAFAGTVSWYGVADLRTLAATTHDFEAHYFDSLVGPLPEAADLYVERSPIHRAPDMLGAVLLLQGLDDPVVPPAQSEAMAAALEVAGRDVTLIEFPGESHGFRRLETLVAAYEAEIAFYERILCHERHGVAL